jgi:predicted GNAT family acetyltransferase
VRRALESVIPRLPRLSGVDVRDNAAESRYEIVDGDELAGYLEYHDHNGRRALNHTVVEPAYEGKGVGSALVRGVLDEARSAGLAILPFCPFVRSYLERHPEYVDLVPEDERPRVDLG